MFLCDWREFDKHLNSLVVKINDKKKVVQNFPLLALIDDPDLQLKASEIYIENTYPPNMYLGPIKKSIDKSKICIGYYSADFREHPVAYLTAELFELHDKDKFELIAFYSGSKESGEMHNRISSSFEKFIYINTMGDEAVAKLSRELGIDIAVDLTGSTGNSRVGVFSYRVAPVQMSYIGYLGTMGVDYYDYLIADKIIIPEEKKQFYKESIIYLPSYQVNDSKRAISNKSFTRQDFGFPENYFIFCCFNNHFKITPSTFEIWMRILMAVPESILLLYVNNKTAQENLRKESEIKGVSSSRRFFANQIPRNEYLARFRVADLFLDTQPYNAGTTASDALWAGLPVLTCLGQSFASRIAASLLNAIDMAELVATSDQQYEYMAVELAKNSDKLKAIKDKLNRNISTTALFDSINFTNNLEDVFYKINNDLPP